MASKELFAQVEQIIWGDRARVIPSKSTDLANEILATILAALQEPTEAMEQAHDLAHAKAETFFADTHDVWRAMLNASPLGEQSNG